MEEMIELLTEIRDLLKSIDEKLDERDDLEGYAETLCETADALLECSGEICKSLNDIKGGGAYYSLSDIHEKLDDIESAIDFQ